MSDKKQQTLVAKLVGTAAALAAAWIAQQVIAQGWKAKTGHKPPKPDDEDDHGLTELVLATAVTGAVVAVSRVLATRGAAKFTASKDDKKLNPTD